MLTLWMILGLFMTLLIMILAYTWWQQRRQPPGPWGLPVLGNLLALDVRAPYKSLQDLAQKYGPIYRLRLGAVNTIVIADALLVRECLRREEFTARAPLYVTHGIMGGYGLICAEGSLWRDQRRQTIDWLKRLGMTKKLGMQRTQLEQRICKGVNECLQTFERYAACGLECDPLPALYHTLGNIINELVFGITYKENDVTWLYFQELQEKGLKLIGVSGVVNFLPILRHLPSNKESINFLLDGKAETHKIYTFIIEDCLQQLLEKREVTEKYECSSILECFLDEKLARINSDSESVRATADEFYNNKQLRHLLADLFGAGVDTTLTTLRWLLLYMAKYPECQQRLRVELATLPTDQIMLSQLESLDYLKACISETQRIRSVVPLGIPHGTLRTVELNGYRVPAKSMIMPLQWAIHMNPEIWPEPEEFKPQRFLNDIGVYHQPAQFIPFQTGKRMCPGDELARMILHLYVARIFRQYQIQLSPKNLYIDMTGECGITLAPPNYKILLKQNE